jgi:hypothetical protein
MMIAQSMRETSSPPREPRRDLVISNFHLSNILERNSYQTYSFSHRYLHFNMNLLKCVLFMAFMKDHWVTCTAEDEQTVDHEMFDLNSSEPQIRHYNKMKSGSIMGKVSKVRNAEGELESRLFAYDMDPVMPPYDNVYDDLVLQVPLKDTNELDLQEEDEEDATQSLSEPIEENDDDSISAEETYKEADEIHSDKSPHSEDATNDSEPSEGEELIVNRTEEIFENTETTDDKESVHASEEIDQESAVNEDSPESDSSQHGSEADVVTSDVADEIHDDESPQHQHDDTNTNEAVHAENIQAVEVENVKEDMEDNSVLESTSTDHEKKDEIEMIQTEESHEVEIEKVVSNDAIGETETEVPPHDSVDISVGGVESEVGKDSENSIPNSDQDDFSVIHDQSIHLKDTEPIENIDQELEGSESFVDANTQVVMNDTVSDASDEIVMNDEETKANHELSDTIQLEDNVEEQESITINEPDQLDTNSADSGEDPLTAAEPDDEQMNQSNVNAASTEAIVEDQTEVENRDDSEDETYIESEESVIVDDIDENDLESILKTVQNNLANDEFVSGLDDVDKFFEEVDPPDELDVGASGLSMQDVLVGQGVQIIKTRIFKGIEQLKRISTEFKVVLGKKWMTFKEFLDDHFDISIDDILLSSVENFEKIAEQYQNISEIVSDKLSDLKDNLEGPYEMARTFYDNELSAYVNKMKQALSKFGFLDDDDEDEVGNDNFVFENFKIDNFDTEEMQRRLNETRSKLM